MSGIKESDWKIFKEIKEKAIDLYCQQSLSEFANAINQKGKGNHEKYVYLYKLVDITDRKMEVIFGDNTSRSKALLQLMAIRGEGLADQELVAKLSDELQAKTDPANTKW